MIKFRTVEKDRYTLVEFELEGPISPEILKDLTPPKVDTTKGVVLSGRGPIWLYGYLIHFYHPTLWVATNDPRIGAVVVMTHTPERSEGDIIQVN